MKTVPTVNIIQFPVGTLRSLACIMFALALFWNVSTPLLLCFRVRQQLAQTSPLYSSLQFHRVP